MAHFNPRPSKIVSRFKFNSRSQQPGEPIAAYASELWKLSKFCGFGESLDNMLCDWLVSGLAEQRVQQHLLAGGDVTFNRTRKIAGCDVRDLQQVGAHRASVHKLIQQLGSSKQSKGGNNCHRCEGSHELSQCCFRDAECHACGKKGHIKRACRSRSKTSPTLVSTQGTNQPVYRTEEETLIETQEYRIYPLQDPATRPWKTTVRVTGHDVIMEVDTETSVTLASEATLGVSGLCNLPHPCS